MVPKASDVAIILLAISLVTDSARIRPDDSEGQEKVEKQPQVTTQNTAEDTITSFIETSTHTHRAFADRATPPGDGQEADSAAAAQEAASPPSAWSSALNVTLRKQLGAVPDVPHSKKRKLQRAGPSTNSFHKLLEYVRDAPGGKWSRQAILEAACDSHAFSCEEIIQLTGGRSMRIGGVMLFAEGRDGKGCISDPENARSICKVNLNPDAFLHPPSQQSLKKVKDAFINNRALEPARDLRLPVKKLQTGFRTDNHMQILLESMAELQLIKEYAAQGLGSLEDGRKLELIKGQWVGGLYQAGSASALEFERWLKHTRAHGEQFSGSQLVALVQAIPRAPLRGPYFELGEWKGWTTLEELDYVQRVGHPENFPWWEQIERNSGTAQAASVLLQYLEQYVAGVSCEEVKQIIQHVMWEREDFFFEGLNALKSNIVDPENKVDIVAFVDWFGDNHGNWGLNAEKTEKVLRDVSVRLSPKSNPIFGVVRGNPVIIVVDESTYMDANVTVGDEAITRQKFANRQLEAALKGLPDGTHFNVIQYSGSATQIFEKPVLATKTTIEATMQSMGTTWRGNFTPGQDPSEMLNNLKVFALKLKHRLKRSTERNSMEALRLAYASAGEPLPQTYDMQHTLHHRGEAAGLPGFFRPGSYAGFFPENMPGKHEWQWIPEPLALVEELPQIYFLASGQPDSGARQILDSVDEFDKARSIPVNSIAFTTPADFMSKQFVKELALQTGGFFRSIEQASL